MPVSKPQSPSEMALTMLSKPGKGDPVDIMSQCITNLEMILSQVPELKQSITEIRNIRADYETGDKKSPPPGMMPMGDEEMEEDY